MTTLLKYNEEEEDNEAAATLLSYLYWQYTIQLHNYIIINKYTNNTQQ